MADENLLSSDDENESTVYGSINERINVGEDNSEQLLTQVTDHTEEYFSSKRIEEYGVLELLLFSVKHVFWVLFTSAPAIIFVSLSGFAYSRLPWSDACVATNTTNNITSRCIYYNETTILVFDGIVRSVSVQYTLFCTTVVVISSHFRDNI